MKSEPKSKIKPNPPKIQKPNNPHIKYKENTFEYKCINNWWAIICIFGFILYARVLSFDFIGLDDIRFLVASQQYFKEFSNFFKGFAESSMLDYYRPLLFSSFILDFQFGGVSPKIYHFSNIIFHIISCILLFRLLVLLKYDKFIVLLTTLLFMAHPLFVQAVGWVFGRNDPLLCIFTLASLIYFIKYLQLQKQKYYVLHILWAFAALFTKEAALGLFIICFVYLFLFTEDPFQKNKKVYTKMIFTWGIICCLWLLIRYGALKAAFTSAKPGEGVIIDIQIGWESIQYNIPFLSESIAKFFIPWNLSVWAMYSSFTTYLGIITYFLLFGIIYWLKPSYKIAIWTFFWWFAFIFPPTLFVATHGAISDYLEHRIYVPAIACIILLNEMLKHILLRYPTKNNIRNTIKYALITLVCILSLYTFQREAHFKNEEAFWKNATETSPQSAHAWQALSKTAFDKGDLLQTEKLLIKSLSIKPGSQIPTLLYIGGLYEQKNDFAGALRCYNAIWNNDNTNIEAPISIARLYGRKNQFDTAEFFFQKALSIQPNNIDALLGMGIIAYNTQRTTIAEQYWKKVINIQSDNSDAHSYLITIYLSQKRTEEAKILLQNIKNKGKDLSQNFPELQ